MKHLEDDELQKSVLQLLDEHEERQLQEHLLQCDDCRTRFDLLRQQTEIIGSLEPEIEQPDYPLPRAKRAAYIGLLKVAALLLIGFLVGFGVSELSRPVHVNVVQQQLDIPTPSISVTRYASCEPVDIEVVLD